MATVNNLRDETATSGEKQQPKELLTFLGLLGNAEFSPWKRLPEFIELRKSYVTASDAMDFFWFTDYVMFLR